MVKKKLIFIIIAFTACTASLIAMNNDESNIELDTIEHSNHKPLIIIEDNTQNNDAPLEIIPKFQMHAPIKKKIEWRYACCKNAYDDPSCMEERWGMCSRCCGFPGGYTLATLCNWGIFGYVNGCKESTSRCSFTDPESFCTPRVFDSPCSSCISIATWTSSIGVVICATTALCSLAPWFRGDKNGGWKLNCIRKVKIKQLQIQQPNEKNEAK